VKKTTTSIGKKAVSSRSESVPFLALAWVIGIVVLHYVSSYLLNPKYLGIVERIVSRIFG